MARLAIWVAATTMLLTGAAAAGDGAVHATALHGSPKYGPDFTHFDYAEPNAPKGGEIRLSAFGGFDNLNPFILRGMPPAGAGLPFQSLMVESMDEVFTVYGDLARSVEIAPDRSWVEFELRPEAVFSDGKPVTAEDVIWSFDTLRTKGSPVYRAYWADVDHAERTAERTVRFVFKHGGDTELPLIMGQLAVLPKHWFEGRDFEETTMTPIPGSGPYVVESVDPGRGVVYSRVKNWWGENLPVNKGRYNFDRVRYDYFRDADVTFEAFKAGAFDVRYENSAKNWATGYDFPAAREGRVQREEIKHGDAEGMQAFILNMRRPIFADRRVREAINLLFDFEWMNKALFFDSYIRSNSFFSNTELAARGMPGPEELRLLEPLRGRVPDEVFGPAYVAPKTDGSGNIRDQLRQALGLLKDAGWVIKGDELINATTGEPMRFEFLTDRAEDDRVIQPFIRNLKRAGIEATMRVVDASQYIFRVDQFDFDVVLSRILQSLSPGNEQREMWGSAYADQPGSQNVSGVKDKAVDALTEAVVQAPDRETLVARTRALDRVLTWNNYVVPQWYSDKNRIVRWDRFGRPATVPPFVGPVPISSLVLPLWWIDPAKDAVVTPTMKRDG